MINIQIDFGKFFIVVKLKINLITKSKSQKGN